MTDFAWGIVGPGKIAHRFAAAVHALPGTSVRSVLGRDRDRLESFVTQWSRPGKPAPQAVHDLDALLQDPLIDAVYIATPHSAHATYIRACLLAGKAVLCEKPMVTNLTDAEELSALARSRNVFLMEALWTRFLPSYARVRQWLESGAIGRVQAMQSSICFPAPYDPASRLFNPELAGGSLLDIGIYSVAVTRWVLEVMLGACPEPLSLHAVGTLAPTGVDLRVSATIAFPHGVTSQFVCALDGSADNSLRIFGERGWISLGPRFWEATVATLARRDQPAETVHEPFRVNGFEGEIEEAQHCVRTGRTESARMPHAETRAIAGWLEGLRQQLEGRR